MVVTIRQSHILINKFNNVSINQPVYMADVKFVPIPFGKNTNPIDATGLKI